MASSHTTPFSGSWYPGRPAELEALLDRLFDSSLKRTGPALLPRPLAFVVPHAGLAYSGTVAASAYRHLQAAKPERVFILGFTHQGGRPGVSIPDIDAFETPLGEVTVDRAAAREMASGGQFAMVAEAQVCDHSVEIQLPLLEKAVAGVPVVPLYVGPLNDAGRRAASRGEYPNRGLRRSNRPATGHGAVSIRVGPHRRRRAGATIARPGPNRGCSRAPERLAGDASISHGSRGYSAVRLRGEPMSRKPMSREPVMSKGETCASF